MAASSQLSLISAAFPHFEIIFLPQLNADPQTNTHTFEVLLFERGPEKRELRNCFAKAGTTPQTRGGTGAVPTRSVWHRDQGKSTRAGPGGQEQSRNAL